MLASPLDLSLAVMPHLRRGLTPHSATLTALLLRDHLRLDAAAVISTDSTLAFVGPGADHHHPGQPVRTALALRALATGDIQTARAPNEIGCPTPNCPLQEGVVAPLQVRARTVGALKLYTSNRPIARAAADTAASLARMFAVYLEIADLDAQLATAEGRIRPNSRLPVEQEDHTRLLRIEDIRYVSARGHSVLARTFDADYRVRLTLAQVEALLAPHDFLRVHRAYLVNLDRVEEVHRFFDGAYLLRLDDAEHSEVPVSRALAGRLRCVLGL